MLISTPGGRDPLHDRHRERAVLALAIECNLPLLGREDHERGSGNPDLAQSTADRTGADLRSRRGRRNRGLRLGPAHLRRKGIVTASVEQHQLQLPRPIERGHDLIEGNCLELHVAVGREPGIDGMR